MILTGVESNISHLLCHSAKQPLNVSAIQRPYNLALYLHAL